MGAMAYSSAPDRSRAVPSLPSEKFATARKSPGTEVGLVFPLPPTLGASVSIPQETERLDAFSDPPLQMLPGER